MQEEKNDLKKDKMANKKKEGVKYPFTIFFSSCAGLIILLITTWSILDYFLNSEKMGMAFGISIGISCLFFLVVMFSQGNKLWEREQRQRQKFFEKKYDK